MRDVLRPGEALPHKSLVALVLALSARGCSCDDRRRCVDYEVGGLDCPCATFADCDGLVCGAERRCANPDPRCFPLGADACLCGADEDCVPGLVCQAGLCARPECADDVDCAGEGQVCVRGACFVRGCDDDTDCPPGQRCDGGACVPEDCVTGAGTAGCYTGPAGTAKVGVCDYGIWRCTHDGRPLCAGQHAPDPETCNGADDDCDGATDEDGACDVPAGCVPAVEVCNGADDDCDGATDEDTGTTTCGVGVCQRTVPRCVEGAAATCTPGAPQVGACDGEDDDCDGDVDEPDEGCACRDGEVKPCYSGNPPETEGVGECHGGTQRCAGAAWGACEGERTPAARETCDGRDEDCSGAADDGLGQEVCGVGACRRVQPACAGGEARVCRPGAAMPEVCNAADDDCDGATDEDAGEPLCPAEETCVGGACTGDDTPEVGCADGAREGFLDLARHPRIAACAGAWDVPGVTRDDLVPACGRHGGDDGTNVEGTGCAAADLCATGWRVCRGRQEVTRAAPAGCGDAVPPGTPANGLFFAATQHSENDIVCDDASTGDNDVFGCGNLGVALAPDKGCAPFDRALASTRPDTCGFNEAEPDLGPWQCTGGPGSDLHEGRNVTKAGCPGRRCRFDGRPVGSSDKGGVLCCKE